MTTHRPTRYLIDMPEETPKPVWRWNMPISDPRWKPLAAKFAAAIEPGELVAPERMKELIRQRLGWTGVKTTSIWPAAEAAGLIVYLRRQGEPVGVWVRAVASRSAAAE